MLSHCLLKLEINTLKFFQFNESSHAKKKIYSSICKPTMGYILHYSSQSICDHINHSMYIYHKTIWCVTVYHIKTTHHIFSSHLFFAPIEDRERILHRIQRIVSHKRISKNQPKNWSLNCSHLITTQLLRFFHRCISLHTVFVDIKRCITYSSA